MVRRFSRNKAIAEINVVPYIDVMLVLLVIFMITAPLLTQGVEIELPRAQAEIISSDKREPLIVSVDAQGEYFLNVNAQPQATIAPNTLATRIAAEFTLAGACVNKQLAVCVLGKAITSRIDDMPDINIANRSKPKAIPPCGGQP